MSADQRTHEKISPQLCGRAEELGAGHAKVVLDASQEMAADWRGLIHGGFTFGLADYAVRRWRYEQSLWMTRDELKEELKREEGDPMMRARIRKLRRASPKDRIRNEGGKLDPVRKQVPRTRDHR